MQLTKTHKIILSILAILVLLSIYILVDQKNKEETGDTDISTSTEKTATTTISGTQINTQGTGGYTIERVPINEGKGVPQPVPDLNRISVAANGVFISPEAKVTADASIKSIQAMLKKNPADFYAWLDLGIYQKMAGDYEGVIISWTYVGRLAPTDYISRGNLGNLYAYYLKDLAKAEVYYKQAISYGPTQAILYIQLAEVYRDLFQDKAKARAILDQGLSKIPNDPNLLQLKASLGQ